MYFYFLLYFFLLFNLNWFLCFSFYSLLSCLLFSDFNYDFSFLFNFGFDYFFYWFGLFNFNFFLFWFHLNFLFCECWCFLRLLNFNFLCEDSLSNIIWFWCILFLKYSHIYWFNLFLFSCNTLCSINSFNFYFILLLNLGLLSGLLFYFLFCECWDCCILIGLFIFCLFNKNYLNWKGSRFNFLFWLWFFRRSSNS